MPATAEDGQLARVHYIYTNAADIGRAAHGGGGGPQAPQAGGSGVGEGAGIGCGRLPSLQAPCPRPAITSICTRLVVIG